jgi:Protein of unknown function (DUF1488)
MISLSSRVTSRLKSGTVDPGHHHFETGDIYFYMNNGDQRVRCGVTTLALELLEPELPPTKAGRTQAFKQRRTRIERAASVKFDRGESGRMAEP